MTLTLPRRLALCLAAVLPLLTPAHAADSLMPVETFFSLPTVSSPELSPDGTKIAFLYPKDHRMALGLFDRKTNEARLVLEAPDESIRYFFFYKAMEQFFAENLAPENSAENPAPPPIAAGANP